MSGAAPERDLPAGGSGPWWVTLFHWNGMRWLLRIKFDSAGEAAAYRLDGPAARDGGPPPRAVYDAAERFRQANAAIIAGAIGLAASGPDSAAAGVFRASVAE